MEDNLTPKQRSDIKKAKKRARVNTATGEDVEMIPAVRNQKNIFDDSAKKLVGIYVRVSTVTQTFLQHGRSAVSI